MIRKIGLLLQTAVCLLNSLMYIVSRDEYHGVGGKLGGGRRHLHGH